MNYDQVNSWEPMHELIQGIVALIHAWSHVPIQDWIYA